MHKEIGRVNEALNKRFGERAFLTAGSDIERYVTEEQKPKLRALRRTFTTIQRAAATHQNIKQIQQLVREREQAQTRDISR